MGKDTRFFDAFERLIKLSIHTVAPARVITYNETKRTADVELLFLSVDKEGNREKYPLIIDAPVLGMRYKVPKAIKASITGLIPSQGSIDGSNTSVTLMEDVEFVPSLKKDDVVFVGFAERALDNLNGSKPFDPEYRRTHDIRDAVVLGVVFSV